MKVFLVLILFLLFGSSAIADSLVVVFRPVVHGVPMEFDQPMILQDMKVEWQTVLLYVGGFSTSRDTLSDYFLLGHDDDHARFDLHLPLEVQPGERVTCTVGVDSLTQISGAMRGDLDPQFGMYWAWQSGYISFKLEGRFTLANGTVQTFVYHLGGYRQGLCASDCVLEVDAQGQIIFAPDLGRWLIDLQAANVLQLMSPGAQAVKWFNQLLTPTP